MHWLRRPPYLRWAVAAAIVVIALVVETSEPATVAHPFVRRDTAAGRALGAEDLEWRTVAAGVLAMPRLDQVLVAAHDLRAGEPLLPSSLGAPVVVPSDWWSVPVPLPAHAQPGDPVRLVVLDPLLEIDGIVVAAAVDDPFTYEATGLVAVPGATASAAAAAAAYGGVVVLIHPRPLG